MTTFANIPDAQVSSFRMVLKGGKHGILVVTTGQDACRGAQKAGVVATGQNGKVAKSTNKLGDAVRARAQDGGHGAACAGGARERRGPRARRPAG